MFERNAGGPDRRGPISLGIVLLAFAAGFLRARDAAPPPLFQARAVETPRGEAPRFRSRFVTPARNVHAHSACLVELADGRVRAFWYSGSQEGASDVEVRTAVFDPGSGVWGGEKTVANPENTRRAILRYVNKVGNPTAIRAPDGTLWLFYVTVSVGGWAGSSITVITSHDEGETWDPARRLVSSPLLNLGSMVRGQPFLYADGTIGLPVYQNLLGSLCEELRLDRRGAVIDRQRLGADPTSLQPVILVRSATEALALMRSSGREGPHRVIATATHDAGRHWTPPLRLPLRNPDAALAGLALPDGRLLIALNNIEVERDELSLAVSGDGGATWRTVRQLENQRVAREEPLYDARYDRTVAALARATDPGVTDARAYVDSSRRFMCWQQACHFEFSYPSLIQTRRGEFHLVYTWNRSSIKHVQFNQTWLDQDPPNAPDAELH